MLSTWPEFHAHLLRCWILPAAKGHANRPSEHHGEPVVACRCNKTLRSFKAIQFHHSVGHFDWMSLPKPPKKCALNVQENLRVPTYGPLGRKHHRGNIGYRSFLGKIRFHPGAS